MFKFVSALALGGFAITGCVHVTSSDRSYVEEIEAYDPEVAAIEAVVLDYFDGQGEGSLERLNRAFHPDSSMFGVTTTDDGVETLRVWPKMGDVVKNWAANENPPGAGRDGEVLSIEIVDDRLAVVTFRYADRFYDAFTMLKLNGEWKIAAKTFVGQ